MAAGLLGVREHNTAGELAAVDDRLAQSDRMAAVPLSSSGSAHLDQMAAGLLGVREKKQQREQSVAGWLERSKSPQLMGVSNENTARAQAFTLSREVIFKLFADYVPRSSPTCEKTATDSEVQVRNSHRVSAREIHAAPPRVASWLCGGATQQRCDGGL